MEWVLENANQVGVVGLLLLAFFGLHKEYWVPGGVYRHCMTRVTTLEQEAKDTIKAKNGELNESKDTIKAKNGELDELKRAFYARGLTNDHSREGH